MNTCVQEYYSTMCLSTFQIVTNVVRISEHYKYIIPLHLYNTHVYTQVHNV